MGKPVMGVSGVASRGRSRGGLQRMEASVPGAVRITARKRPLDSMTPPRKTLLGTVSVGWVEETRFL